MKEKVQPDIVGFLLKDTISLRNEIKFTELVDFVHPLTFSYDLKKHSNMNLIPVFDKIEDENLKDNLDNILE